MANRKTLADRVEWTASSTDRASFALSGLTGWIARRTNTRWNVRHPFGWDEIEATNMTEAKTATIKLVARMMADAAKEWEA